jgi:hypothetical protein
MSVVVWQTEVQRGAWRELMTWYARIGRTEKNTTPKEMHALALWCILQAQQTNMAIVEKIRVTHADAPERLVDDKVWAEMIQELHSDGTAVVYNKVAEWRKIVDATYARTQRCEQLLAAVEVRGGCITDAYDQANAYVTGTGSSSLDVVVHTICAATFLRQHTDYVALEFRGRAAQRDFHRNGGDTYKNMYKRQALQAIPPDSPHAAQAQALLAHLDRLDLL